MNPIFLWNNKKIFISDPSNWIGVDLSNKYYKDSNLNGASGTITVGSQGSFSYNDSNTLCFALDSGNDATGDGTYANPYKTLQKCLDNVTLTYNRIRALESGTISTEQIIENDLLNKLFCKGEVSITFKQSVDHHVVFYSTINLSNLELEIYNCSFESAITRYTYTPYYIWESSTGYHGTIQPAFCEIYYLGASGYFSGLSFAPCYNFFYCPFMEDSHWGRFEYCILVCYDGIRNSTTIDTFFSYSIIIKSLENYIQIQSGEEYTGNIFFDCIYDSTISAIYNYNCDNLHLLSGTGNININPLFTNFIDITKAKPTDFQLQIKALGYIANSPCIKTGNAGGTLDIGAWQYSTEIGIMESYKKYLLEHNPKNLFMPEEELQMNIDYSLTGRPFPSKINTKKRFEFEWQENSEMSENDRIALNRISQKKFDNITVKTENNIDILYFDDFENGIDSGTITDIDFTEKSITANKNISTEWIGFQLWFIIQSVTGTISNQTISGFTGLAVNSLIGYWVADYKSNMIYQIISNTARRLTVHDPYNYLSNGTGTAKIIKSNKIFDIDDDIIYLTDDIDSISATATDFIIQEIIIRSAQESTRYSSEIGYKKLADPYSIRTGITYVFIEK